MKLIQYSANMFLMIKIIRPWNAERQNLLFLHLKSFGKMWHGAGALTIA